MAPSVLWESSLTGIDPTRDVRVTLDASYVYFSAPRSNGVSLARLPK